VFATKQKKTHGMASAYWRLQDWRKHKHLWHMSLRQLNSRATGTGVVRWGWQELNPRVRFTQYNQGWQWNCSLLSFSQLSLSDTPFMTSGHESTQWIRSAHWCHRKLMGFFACLFGVFFEWIIFPLPLTASDWLCSCMIIIPNTRERHGRTVPSAGSLQLQWIKCILKLNSNLWN